MHRATRNLISLFERIEDFEARVAARRELSPGGPRGDGRLRAPGLLAVRMLAPVAPHIAEELWGAVRDAKGSWPKRAWPIPVAA